jgi:hypothetical protein
LREAILKKQETVEIVGDYPQEAADFINLCIMKKKEDRISSFKQVREHPWFNGFDWENFLEQKMVPSYRPDIT